MGKIKVLVVILLPILLLTGCASIFSGGPSLLKIMTNPEDAKVTIKGLNNVERITQKTPCAVSLSKASDYSVVIELAGYQSEEIYIRRGTNGWFWGNLFLGGIVGMIIDYSTSNMYEHQPSTINLDLTKLTSLPDKVMIEYPITLIMEDGSRIVRNLPITFNRVI